MRHLLSCLLSLCVTAASAAGLGAPDGGWPATPPTGNNAIDLSERLGNPAARYLLSVPAAYTSDTAWPVAIVLHGGPGGKAKSMADVFAGPLTKRDVIAIFPQALQHQLLDWNYPHSSVYLVHILQDLATRYHLDQQRIYLLGHSMGGGGVWAQGAVLRDIWAGLGPMSGWAVPTPAPDFAGLASVPLYNLHGSEDRAVPIKISELGFEQLRKQRARCVTFAQLPADTGKATHLFHRLEGVGHNIFTPMKERGPALAAQIDWLLKHRRPKPADLQAAGKQVQAWGKRFGWKPSSDQPLGSYAEKRR